MKTIRTFIAAITVLMLWTPAAQAQRYDRGYDMSKPVTFVEKGTWMVGGTADYSLHNMDNYSFLVIDNINSTGYGLSVSPAFCYMIKDNLGLGLRVDYDRNMFKLDNASIDVADIGIDIVNYHAIAHKFKGAAIMRNYLPLGNSRRFAMVNETRLSVGIGQGKVVDGHNEDNVAGSYETSTSFGINLCPGMMAFASDHLAVEFSVNMLGFNISNTRQIHNQVAEGSRTATSVNFKVNVLSVGFGIYYYL